MVEETEPQEQIIRVDVERCIGCFECIDLCPQSSNAEYPVYIKGVDGYPQVANLESCIRCLSCEVNCRALAVKVEGVRASETSSMMEQKAESKSKAMF